MPFTKGKSGNPAGRPPKGFARTEQWRAAADEIDPETGKTYFRLYIEKLREKAIAGDSKAMELFAERVEGKAAQTINVVPEAPQYNLEALTDEELNQLEDMTDKITEDKDDDKVITITAGNTGGENTP